MRCSWVLKSESNALHPFRHAIDDVLKAGNARLVCLNVSGHARNSISMPVNDHAEALFDHSGGGHTRAHGNTLGFDEKLGW